LKQLQELDYLVKVGILDGLGKTPAPQSVMPRVTGCLCRRSIELFDFGLWLVEATDLLQVRDKNFKHHLLQSFGGFCFSYLLPVADELRENNFGYFESRLAESSRVWELLCQRRR